jgi:hypothetical protein
MNISQLDTALSSYVWEKNRKRIQDDSKRPMLSSPISLWRSAKGVDDIRADMINKVSALMIVGHILNLASVTNNVQNIVASLLSTCIPVWVLQVSRMHNNWFWKIMSKDPIGWPRWRVRVGAMFVLIWSVDFLRMQLTNVWINEALYCANSILYHYILFHLIYTRDELPKKKEEILDSQNALVPVT